MADKLTEQQRAERVLCSHGRAAGMLGSFPADVQKALSAFCSEAGEIVPGSWDEAEGVMHAHWDSLKATVDEGPAPEPREIAAAAYETYKLPENEVKQ